MTHTDFETAAREIVSHYWRVRAALRLVEPPEHAGTTKLQYAGIPQEGTLSNFLVGETISEALAALERYAKDRLVRDMFTALIGEFERRLNSGLAARSLQVGGTLGKLQTKIENAVSLTPDSRQDLDEIRERRNALAHHDGLAHPKYVNAAAHVAPRAPKYVRSALLGDNVIPDENYLTYSGNALIRYSQQL